MDGDDDYGLNVATARSMVEVGVGSGVEGKVFRRIFSAIRILILAYQGHSSDAL
jgi:hypothetical protein